MPNEYKDNQWWSETESPKAWMSVRDADLYEALIHRLGQLQANDALRVIEWGAGQSTLWYSKYLESLGIPFSWLSLEHNKTFFEERYAHILKCRPNAFVISEDDYELDKIRALLSRPGVTAVVLYDMGEVRPDRQGRIEDRAVDLDAYVSFPARVGLECDLAVIDGRKRRRCLLEAARVLSPAGYVILHDAWRSYYHCAFSSFRSGRRFGDEWWIGSNIDTTFEDVLPWHAFERHATVEKSLEKETYIMARGAGKDSFLKAFDAWLAAAQRELIADLRHLVAMDTASPNEHLAHSWLASYFSEIGGAIRRLSRHPRLAEHPAYNQNEHSGLPAEIRSTLRVEFPALAASSGSHTLFSAHVDVVPAGTDFKKAFQPMVVGDRVIGRGTADTKGNIIMLGAALKFLRDTGRPLSRTVSLDLVSEEEIGGNGALSSILYGTAATDVIVLEPSSLEVFTGHRGCTGFAVDFAGRSSHMGGLGLSAIDGALEYVRLLGRLESELICEAGKHPMFANVDRPVQINVGMISGGEWPGSIPASCTVRGFFGFGLDSSASAAIARLRDLVPQLSDPWYRAHTVIRQEGIHNGAYLCSPDVSIARNLRRAVASVSGDIAGGRAWHVSCDARLYHDYLGVPTVIFGAGSLADAHSSGEGLDIPEWFQGVAALARFLTMEPETSADGLAPCTRAELSLAPLQA